MLKDSHPDKVGTRRDRRIQRQRRAIMDAAAQLFARKGYRSTTTKEIAQSVDIGESTLYGYFSSKQEVLTAILSQQAEMMDAWLARISDLRDPQSFVDLADLLMERILTTSTYNRVVIAEAWSDDEVLQVFVLTRWQPILERLQAFLSEKSATGIFRPIDPRLGARMIMTTFISMILPFLRGMEALPSPAERHALAQTMVAFVYHGLAA